MEVRILLMYSTKLLSKSLLSALLVFTLILSSGVSQARLIPGTHRIGAADNSNDRLLSNSIIDIKVQGDTLWFGTGQGISRLDLSTESWMSIEQSDSIGRGGVSAIAVSDTIIWAATAYTEHVQDQFLQAGGGVGYSRDSGLLWTWMDQPVDTLGENRYSPTTTNIQNVTFDIAISESGVWITSWGGGLRRKLHDSEEWEVKTPDGQPFAVATNLNHRAFSAVYGNGTLWIGTAAGIHRTDDEGEIWVKYSHLDGLPTISGNFVVALAIQEVDNGQLVWGATWKAEGGREYWGISVTEDDGASWRVALSDSTVTDNGELLIDRFGNLRVHNFGFKDTEVFAAADDALWWHPNRGRDPRDWRRITSDDVVDELIGEKLENADFFSAAHLLDSQGRDSLWIGTDDGLVVRWFDDTRNKYVWKMIRAYKEVNVAGEPETYAAPNPFSPRRGQIARFQIPASVSVEAVLDIWDFAMDRVYGPVLLPGGGAGNMAGFGNLKWNGNDNSGNLAANGVYFYRIRAGGKTYWGKVMVLD